MDKFIFEVGRIYTGTEKPKVYGGKHNNRYYIYVPFIWSETPKNDTFIYTWEFLMILNTEYNYSKLIEEIIKLKYSDSEVIARLNNYISEPNNSKYKSEYEELQSWRKIAKEYAKKHFNVS